MVDTNLIQQNEGFYFLPIDPGEKIVYFDVDIDIGDTKAICLGRVALSKAGQVLMSIVTDKVKVDGFDELACIAKSTKKMKMKKFNFQTVITPQPTSYNVKKCSEGFPFERLY